jgi:Xaa-Pro aminopeptidase
MIKPGEFGLHLENEVIVTADGCKVISATMPYDKMHIISE